MVGLEFRCCLSTLFGTGAGPAYNFVEVTVLINGRFRLTVMCMLQFKSQRLSKLPKLEISGLSLWLLLWQQRVSGGWKLNFGSFMVIQMFYRRGISRLPLWLIFSRSFLWLHIWHIQRELEIHNQREWDLFRVTNGTVLAVGYSL